MKRMNRLRSGLAIAATTSAALALLVCAAPQAAEAAPTTAGATVYNKVTVTYASGTVSGLSTSSSVSVTVTTLAALPTITVDSQTASILSGANHTYTYTIRSNSNGSDTYTVSLDASSSDSNMDTANGDSIAPTPITLWGGFVIGSGDGYITVPGGSNLNNPLALNSKVMLTVDGETHSYNVDSVAAGKAASDTEAEEYGEIHLSPIGGSPAISGSNVATGTQVGEYQTFQNTVTAGEVTLNPSTVTIADGTHVTYLSVVTTATAIGGSTLSYVTNATDVTTTTILAPKLSILKESKNVTAGGNFATSGTQARPGEVLEYRITITNLHTLPGATISDANVADTLPLYTTYVADSTKIAYDGAAATDLTDPSAGVSPLAGAGYDLLSPLEAGKSAVITYRAIVN